MYNQKIEAVYQIAKERYAELGVDTDEVLKILQKIEISMHCWQGDDFNGYETDHGGLTGGIMATGNYMGRARNATELRADYEKAFALIPAKQRANLHAIYRETNGRSVERNEIEIAHFEGWMDWAKEQGYLLTLIPLHFLTPKHRTIR